MPRTFPKPPAPEGFLGISAGFPGFPCWPSAATD